MIELIITIIFIISFGGVLLILARKMPVLNTLPQNGTTGIKEHHFVRHLEERIKDIALAFKKQVYLHKFLSFVKVLTLKIETRVDHLLHNIRKKAQEVDKNLPK